MYLQFLKIEKYPNKDVIGQIFFKLWFYGKSLHSSSNFPACLPPHEHLMSFSCNLRKMLIFIGSINGSLREGEDDLKITKEICTGASESHLEVIFNFTLWGLFRDGKELQVVIQKEIYERGWWKHSRKTRGAHTPINEIWKKFKPSLQANSGDYYEYDDIGVWKDKSCPKPGP